MANDTSLLPDLANYNRMAVGDRKPPPMPINFFPLCSAGGSTIFGSVELFLIWQCWRSL